MFYAAVLKAIRENAISPKERFHPFPTIDEREKWEALSTEAKSYYASYAKSARERTFPYCPPAPICDISLTATVRNMKKCILSGEECCLRS